MTKNDFRDRFFRAIERLRASRANMVLEELRKPDLLWLPHYNDTRGTPAPLGLLKYFGGRHLAPEAVDAISVPRAAELLWVDGRVPIWVNVYLRNVDPRGTHYVIHVSDNFVPADPASFPPDIGESPGNDLVPFRLRGPTVPDGWSFVQNGKLSIAVERYRRAEEHSH